MTGLTSWFTTPIKIEAKGYLASVTTLWSARLLGFLLTGDAIFIIIHLLLVFTAFKASNSFRLSADLGFPEWFQYFKFGGAICLLALLTRRQWSWLYVYWAGLLVYLLLDDMQRIHEKAGLWFANTVGLPAVAALRARDVGELVFAALLGIFCLTLFVLAYQLSDHQARKFSQHVLSALLALAFFGIVADVVHQMASRPFLNKLMVIVEDGGELVMGSFIVWLVYKQTEKVNAWTGEQVQRWVQVTAVPLAIFVLFTAVSAFIQYGTPSLVGNDGYYHAKMGLLMHEQGVKPTPPQLPLTILNPDDFYNHHLLYHFYLSLFAKTDPVLDGGLALMQQVKVATVLLSAAPFMAIWWLLRGQGVRWAALWTFALLALSSAFLYRMSMPRAQAASLLVLVLGLHWLLQGRYRLLLPLGMVYVWLYDAFPLLLVFSGIYFAVVALTERRYIWPALLYPAAGILIGLVVNPYFPQNFTFITHHLLPKLWDASAVPVGNEWYPYDTWTLTRNSGMALGLFILTLFLCNWHGQRMDGRMLTLFLITAVFGFMLFRSRRFIEYFPPFVLIFAALSLSPLLTTWMQKWQTRQPWVLAGLVLFLSLPVAFTVKSARTAVSGSAPSDQFAAAALWLNVYSQPGSTIFQTDWADFPRLFFYDSDSVYTAGLDPTFMSRHDFALYAEWVLITQGNVLRPSTAIREQFNADYVFSDLQHEAFLEQAAHDPGLQKIYQDNHAIIFAVNHPENWD